MVDLTRVYGTFIQGNARPLQPHQYSFFGMCRYVVLLALRWILALPVLG